MHLRAKTNESLEDLKGRCFFLLIFFLVSYIGQNDGMEC